MPHGKSSNPAAEVQLIKDIIIKKETVKRELTLLGISFILACAMNIYAILSYKGSWTELFTQLHVVLLLSLFIYIIIIPVRLLYPGFRILLKRINRNRG